MAKILVISPTPSHPQDAGNRMRIFSLLSGLKAVGQEVFFAFIKMEVGDESAMAETWKGFFPITYQRPVNSWLKRISDKLAQKLGIVGVFPYRIDDWYTPEISHQLDKIKQQVQPQVVLVEYIFLSKAFHCFDHETLKILDTHDIFGERHKLYLQNNMVPQWFYTTVAQEKKALDRADVILAIQQEEVTYFRRLTQREVINVGHIVQVSNEYGGIDSKGDHLLFVGSANPINVDALRWFLKEVFPLVHCQFQDIKLEVIGECAEKFTPAENLILTGSVVDLAPCYRRAKLVINPARFGTGLKIKTIEALAHRRPLVTTRIGAAGVEEWEGKAFLIANTPEEFAEAIKHVWVQEEIQSSLKNGSIQFIKKYNQDVLSPLLSIISSKY
jgi:glycosyltransferase involved in cell wall biosynthesis